MTISNWRRPLTVGAALFVAATSLAACGDSDEAATSETTEATTDETSTEETSTDDTGSDDTASDDTASDEEVAGASLADVCPATVVIQADWEPEAEHGGIYQLIGGDYSIDANAKSVAGPLVVGGTDTGVAVEIRIGGSSVGYQSAQSLLYQDRDILMGYGRTSEYMVAVEDTPVTAVLSTMDKSPYAIYWDPATYPDVATIADLKDSGATISVGPENSIWVDYLIGTGQIDESQLDRSDQNKPAMFVASGGELAEAGFLTAEPFMYEFEIPEWGTPVIGELLADAGYPEYFQALVVRTDDLEAQADCLTALVPIMQSAQASYIADPAETNELIVELVDTYDTGWVYTLEGAEFAHTTGVAEGILADGADGVMGSFDVDRVQNLIDIVAEYSSEDVSDITPDDLVTNQFLDTSISAGS